AVQPAAIALYRRYFLSRRIEIFESFVPDIGYFDSGPTFGLMGVIRNANEVSVITRIHLDIRHASSGSKLRVTACINRTRSVSGESGVWAQKINGVPWIPFQIADDAAQVFDVYCFDTKRQQQATAVLQKYHLALLQNLGGRGYSPMVGTTLSPAPISLEAFQLYRSEQFYIDARRELLEMLYWKAGRFEVTMSLAIDGDKRAYSQTWTIDLTADDVSGLEGNVDRVLAFCAGVPPVLTGDPFFASPTFRATTKERELVEQPA
nr:hypothetical protein [Candidatus Eremiobacteraeota bacterium]